MKIGIGKIKKYDDLKAKLKNLYHLVEAIELAKTKGDTKLEASYKNDVIDEILALKAEYKEDIKRFI